MLRALLATAISGALTVALITAAPTTAAAATNDHRVIATRGSGLGELPVTLPPTRKRSLEGTALAVGETLSVTWDQQQFDAEEQLYASRLDVLGATEGLAYQLTLHGSGPISAFVVDADGEIVTYASHPFAQSAAPTLEWEFAPGDVIVLVSDDLPLDSRTATVRLTAYVGDGSLPSTLAGSLPASGVSGAVRPTSPAVPFHGGHFDARWALNAGAGSQNNVVLSFEGDEEDTDWLSVLVLDDQLIPIDEIPVESGVAAFTLAEHETFVVTSYLPDEFGSYTFQWLTGSEDEITDIIGPSWWTLSSQPGYRVEFDRSGSVEASSGWLGELGPSHSVEISRDGEAWAPGKVERPDVDVDEGGVRILLLDGLWQLRLVTELGGVEFVADPIAFRAAGDDLGWRVTSLRLSTPKEQYTPGRGSWYRDLRNSVVATETYRDGTTRTRRITPDRVQFQYAGKPGWLGLTEGASDPRGTVRVPANGTLRVADKSGKVLSNEIAVSVPKGTKSYRGSVAKPTKSPTVGGAMVLKGHIEQQYPDGTWQPAEDASSYSVEKKSGRSWKRVYTGRVSSTGKGAFGATVPLDGKGTYRVVAGGRAIKTLALNPARATKTAKVAKPVVSDTGSNRYGVRVDIDQRFSDGKWGQGRFGWTYQLQYREVGAKKWRSTPKSSIPRSSAFDDDIRVSGDVEFRVKARYKGRVYYSPVTKA